MCKCIISSLSDFKENHYLSLNSCLSLQLCIFVTAFSVPVLPQMKKRNSIVHLTNQSVIKYLHSIATGTTLLLSPQPISALVPPLFLTTAKNKDTYLFCNLNVSGIRIPVHTVLGFWLTLVKKKIPKIIKRTTYTL